MPMGLCNAPATFQSLMNCMFHDSIDVFMVVYIYKLLIFSPTHETHLHLLKVVLERLLSEQLFVSQQKYLFMQEEIAF